MSLAPELAIRLGRPDLSRTRIRVLPAGTSQSDRDSGLASAGAAAQVGPDSTSAAVGATIDTGQLTAGTMFVVTLLIIGFYLWTRGHQA